jgi:hypothetical protein
MDITIKEVHSKQDLKEFIYLPEKIHKGQKNWVYPIYMDDWVLFSSKKNKSFEYCDTKLLLAYKGKELAGRIMGIINRRYNELHHENDGRFCFMEAYDDPEVFHAMIVEIENWARQKGMSNLVGPLGFSDKDPQGFMIEGFGEVLSIATNGNFPYMPQLLEKEGYSKKTDCVVYKSPIPDSIPPFYEAIYKRAMSKNNIIIHEYSKRSQLKPFVRPILKLLNESFKDIYAFAPFEEKEMDDFANRYLFLLDPRFIKFITDKQGNMLSFIIAMPNISEGINAAKGKIIPFGIFRIIKSRNRSKLLNLMLGGIREEYRGQGLDVIMGVKLLTSAKQRGMEYLDSHLVLEGNTKMRMEVEKTGGFVYKRYRIFAKQL